MVSVEEGAQTTAVAIGSQLMAEHGRKSKQKKLSDGQTNMVFTIFGQKEQNKILEKRNEKILKMLVFFVTGLVTSQEGG